MANQQHAQWWSEGVEAWNRRREAELWFPDLSGECLVPPDMLQRNADKADGSPAVPEWFPLKGVNLSSARLSDADLNYADLTDANLRGAVLNGAKLYSALLPGANIGWAHLIGTNLSHADLSSADLYIATLTDAYLNSANLTNASLKEADLTGAYLNDANITRTNLIGTDLAKVAKLPPHLWKARLYPENQSPEQHAIESNSVESVGSLLERIQEVKALYNCGDDEVLLYFRGESQCGWELRPGVMRHDNLLTAESTMLVELTSRRPEDFVGASSALAQWMLAQHHGLPTRFLDITNNPLVALYHACPLDAPSEPKAGRLHVFVAPRSLVKPFNSDTVSIIANLAKLSREDQYELVAEPGFRHPEAMRRLYQQIRLEKPYFDERIDPRDFYRVIIVEPQQSSERIRAQSGAFLASAFHARFERDDILRWNTDTPVYAHYELTVPADHKQEIREELRLLNVTRATLFPGLDASAEAIKGRMVASVKPWQPNDGSIDIRFAKAASP